MKTKAYEIELFGTIQGVGFRPFVYNLAQNMNLRGYVENRHDKLLIYVETMDEQELHLFVDSILHSNLPNASITHHRVIPLDRYETLSNDFVIMPSRDLKDSNSPCNLPLDTRICNQCLADMHSAGRFTNYAFVTCTHCGARYSIINALPYDRIRTSMQGFPMCDECREEYTNPSNRRFHAQPISCLKCAIRLSLIDSNGERHIYKDYNDDIHHIKQVAEALKAGKIVAIKGVGGFNLVANANNKDAIITLRKRKNRPHKPFALMFKNMDDIQSLSYVSALEREAILSPQAPIVLLQRHYKDGGILDNDTLDIIAPQVETLGVILPYNAIMHLLFEYIQEPLIFTSANRSSEPIITDGYELVQKLCKEHIVADMVLDYNRNISNAVDDSVVRLIAGAMRPLRLARGYAPTTLALNFDISNNDFIMGVGAEQKSTVSLLSKNQILLSSYIGDLQSVDSIKRYEYVSTFLLSLYSQNVNALVHDLHPYYFSTQKARDSELKKYTISHHKAHFYAILAEFNALDESAMGIIWDGTGFGEDGHIWGGECFLYTPSKRDSNIPHTMLRIFHFDEFVLLGGESSIKDIGKLALSLMWHYDIKDIQDKVHFNATDVEMLKKIHKQGVYPLTSSVGRLIDAVAYILRFLDTQSYEGQSGALIESYAMKDSSIDIEPYNFVLDNGLIYYAGILDGILQDRDKPSMAARRFLETLAYIALALAKSQKSVYKVYFSGGVFQNKFLCDRIADIFTRHQIPFYMHEKLPCNDGNISFGQAVFGALHLQECVE